MVARVGPSLAVTLDGKANNGRLLIIPVLTDGLAVRLDDAWRVPGYGQKTPSRIVHYTKNGPAPAQFITVLAARNRETVEVRWPGPERRPPGQPSS